jgi:hypothetical protein
VSQIDLWDVRPLPVNGDRDEGREGSALDAALGLLRLTVSNLLADDLGELGRAVKEARAS